jgi:hypothetical protein
MRVNSKMSEFEFIEEIDDNFFFDTDEEYEEAARIGCAISDNAALMVGYELAKGGSLASPEVNAALLGILERERPTPVVLASIPVVKSLLEGKPPDPEGVSRLLAACDAHSSAWSGLGIVLCADDRLEPEVETIMARWRGTGGTPKET